MWYGKAGIYTSGKSPVEIDDVMIFGRDIDFDVWYEIIASQNNDRFSKDVNGMESWAGTTYDWDNSIPYKNYRTNVYGDKLWILMTITPRNNPDGIINLVLNSTPGDSNTGYRAELNTANGKTACTLYQNNKAIIKKTINSNPNDKGQAYLLANITSTIRFIRDKDIITLSIDGDIILTAKVNPALTSGFLPAFSATGRYPDKTPVKSDTPTVVQVLSPKLLDYTFGEAPVDWYSEGVWAASTRWACDPEWSFLAGYSNGRVALWNKNILNGDHKFQAYLGIKMEYPREHNTYYERYRDLNISICTDGMNPMSGYSGVYGDKDGRMVLYRNGAEVVSQKLNRDTIPNGRHHNLWYDLTLDKTGNQVTFTGVVYMRIDEERGVISNEPQIMTLTFTDDNPIDGGVPVIWSYNNGISVARSRISFDIPPTLREGAFTAIEMPWYPEFVSVGTPLVLDVKTISTDDKDVTLNVKNILLPKDPTSNPQNPRDVTDPLALTVKGSTLTFKPTFVGIYQYDITGIADGVISPDVNLFVHVFDPIQNKKVTDNLLLRYDFTEGQGNIIHDTSGNGEPVNLIIDNQTYLEKDEAGNTVTKDSGVPSAAWIEGQGIAVNTMSSVLSDKGLGTKLEVLKDTNTITIEMWVSLATIYSENLMGWLCSYFEINDPDNADGSKRWLTFGQNGGNLFINSMNGRLLNTGVSQKLGSVRTGLQHIIITYDPDTRMTTCYI